jgi:hypothetical protein
MNNSELDAKLKAAREPALPADYREDFPRQVLAALRAEFPSPVTRHPSLVWLPRLAWGMATAACILIAFAIGHWRGQTEAKAGNDVLANTEFIQGTLAMFPNRVRAIVQDERGVNLVLSDTENVPASTPIYVRICEGKRCSSLVTFSGQEIQIAGQKLTVLSQPDGGIILEGHKFVWSSSEPVYADRKLKIEAKNLGTITM